MSWPYRIELDLTHDQKHGRRLLLDRYGVYAQLSAFIPILAYQLYRLGAWVYSERQRAKVRYEAVPSSPGMKRARQSTSGLIVTKWRATVWWLESEVSEGWGLRGHWIALAGWTTWLLFLCVHKTGEDYLHITKRFGMIAISQFPLHYMLSMKSRISPLAFLFRTSHEQLNPWHRLSGRVIYFLLLCHVSWYLNFFVQKDILLHRLKDPVVIIGVLAITVMSILMNSSLEIVRRWSYRVFFICHLIIGITLLPLLWFHAHHLRIYVSEALALFIIDLIVRKLDTITGFAAITSIPSTNLVKLKIPVPSSKLKRFNAAPGQHVYLNLPKESTPSDAAPFLNEMLFNPFTIASVSSTDITLILRTLNGPTTQWIQSLAHLDKAKPPINIEGPLGSSPHFPNFAVRYDRILLIAGGVGVTFILPIYKSLQEQFVEEGKGMDKLKCVWSMRERAEAVWAFDGDEEELGLGQEDNLNIFFTGEDENEDEEAGKGDGVEMGDLKRNEEGGEFVVKGQFGRPDLRKIVDEVFRMGNEERVAVLVCGPGGMAREVRGSVGRWVEKGRVCWFHDESFGW